MKNRGQKTVLRVLDGPDKATGCAHYHSALDRVAIRFPCCGRYYACYLCHQTLADHPPQKWQPAAFTEKAILCGHCETELTIHQYLSCNSRCTECEAPFNPGCQKHWDLYFGLH
jgi:uncharacterized CHY-type Zn-finger protein